MASRALAAAGGGSERRGSRLHPAQTVRRASSRSGSSMAVGQSLLAEQWDRCALYVANGLRTTLEQVALHHIRSSMASRSPWSATGDGSAYHQPSDRDFRFDGGLPRESRISLARTLTIADIR